MTEIKQEIQGSNQTIPEERPKPNLKAALRLAQKQQQDIISALQHLHNRDIIRPISYDQEKTQLQKYLDMPSETRIKKICKSIKAELSYLPCFQVHSQTDMPKELLAIMKRDIDMLISVVSKFVHASLYPKGTIIESVTAPRRSVKILLKGQISVFEPINYKSYKNCLKSVKQGMVRTEWLDDIIARSKMSPQHFSLQALISQKIAQMAFNPEDLEAEIEHNLKNRYKPLSQQVCKKILVNSGIISPNTPHRLTVNIRQTGHLISSERQPYVVSQTKSYQHTAICLTQCYVMELEYDIYKMAVSLLNSDEQKRYIHTILKKFPMFEYFDAKQYVKKEYMIDKRRQEAQAKKQLEKLEKNGSINIENQAQARRQQIPIQKIMVQKGENAQSEQSQSSSIRQKSVEDDQMDIETYQIKYDGDVYLIVSGEVTIIIDKIWETRLSQLEHASKIRSFQSHQVLKLYSTDIFGFEEIGKVKEYNLRYRVNKNSKLLLLSQNIYVRHFSEIEGFRTHYKSLQTQRNILIASILKRIEENIENQQVKRYQSLIHIQAKDQLTPKNTNKIQRIMPFASQSIIKRVQFVGKNQFQKIQHKIIDKMARQKQGQSSSISFKQMIKTGKQLKDSLSFASIYKSHLPKNCEIVGNFIEVRDKNGVLKRKKCIVEQESHHRQKQKLIFRKLGIISDEDRNSHNFALIRNRRSKYVLEDFDKQKKQMNRLRQISHSLPKLNQFFAKKEEILYNNIHKRDL